MCVESELFRVVDECITGLLNDYHRSEFLTHPNLKLHAQTWLVHDYMGEYMGRPLALIVVMETCLYVQNDSRIAAR